MLCPFFLLNCLYNASEVVERTKKLKNQKKKRILYQSIISRNMQIAYTRSTNVDEPPASCLVQACTVREPGCTVPYLPVPYQVLIPAYRGKNKKI